jgi:hypothetical protein
VGGAQDRVLAGGGWAQVNATPGDQQLAQGLPVGSTVVVTTSRRRGEVGHVAAARVTNEGVQWADLQGPTVPTTTQIPPEVASAAPKGAAAIDPAGRVIDPQASPVLKTSRTGRCPPCCHPSPTVPRHPPRSSPAARLATDSAAAHQVYRDERASSTTAHSHFVYKVSQWSATLGSTHQFVAPIGDFALSRNTSVSGFSFTDSASNSRTCARNR